MSKVYKSKDTQEWLFGSDQYILSETDDKGIILYANDIFCEIAGYQLSELVGQPHNIVRHPDMPKIAFKGLWDDIRSKGFWSGVVKNLRKDGGYYWVYATVLKRVSSNGDTTYLSIRRVADRKDIKACTDLYAKLKKDE